MTTAVETRYRFTVEEYHKLGEAGIFTEDDRVELLNGDIIIMAPIGIRHIQAVRRLIRVMEQRFHDQCIVDCQNPFILDGVSEPQPDILLLRLDALESEELPAPGDIHLIVEVAESSLGYDRSTKHKAYAAAGIGEFWIVNLVNKLIEVYRDPAPEGYRTRLQVRPGESIAPLAFPDTPIAANDILA